MASLARAPRRKQEERARGETCVSLRELVGDERGGNGVSTATGNGNVILALDDVHTFYGTIEALKGISLEVREREVVTLIGANGAGKSTTLRSINGLNHPKEGTIVFNGTDITDTAPHEIVRMGISQSPEGRRVFPRMSVLENLEMGAYQREDRSGIGEDLDRVYTLFPRLQERKAQKAGTLSGGEQQMLAMGRALMARPQLLLLDEPSMGLAPIFVEKIFEIIQEINQQGTPILLVEQNALMALDIANRGYVLETGHVALADDAKVLRENEQVRKTYLGEE
jgi:branched-chain amino acid transport system ATP-binding protein